MAEGPTPEEMTEQMFAAVGRAITQWSFLEAQLSQLFAVCTGAAVLKRDNHIQFIENWTSMWTFYAVENFRSRLQVVDAALFAHVYRAQAEDDLRSEWGKLSLKTQKLARKRNKLAHWTVKPAQRTGTAEPHEPIAPAKLLPPYGSPGWYRETGLNPKGHSLTVVQVGHLEKAFCLLDEKIRIFTHKVAGTEELRVKSAHSAIDRLLLGGQLDQRLLAELIRVRTAGE
jgi:hypothetical protein